MASRPFHERLLPLGPLPLLGPLPPVELLPSLGHLPPFGPLSPAGPLSPVGPRLPLPPLGHRHPRPSTIVAATRTGEIVDLDLILDSTSSSQRSASAWRSATTRCFRPRTSVAQKYVSMRLATAWDRWLMN
ncbi:hypothetical protein K402DRAFT_36802 [Aulographum hederae CBS 113979]|uniref:Uncharacterized protein n=1 Tax=Aulographum hederae CBS 113979 TaxID=1176131 RepID=A0A6G1H4J8_9PEZI|nr:hypothetical protein K402DRAFT_36802 [Aulographum hederae CBS 113979]